MLLIDQATEKNIYFQIYNQNYSNFKPFQIFVKSLLAKKQI